MHIGLFQKVILTVHPGHENAPTCCCIPYSNYFGQKDINTGTIPVVQCDIGTFDCEFTLKRVKFIGNKGQFLYLYNTSVRFVGAAI